MPSETRAVPVLPVRNVRAALEHYRKLGFAASAYGEADDPIYGFVDRDGMEIHLSRFAAHDPKTSHAACYLYVDDANALYEEWRAAQPAGRFTEPGDTPYGLREFTHVDPDGNLLRVGSELTSRSA